MKLGFIYAGQGSQRVGMGMDFYDSFDSYKAIIDQATNDVKNITDFNVKELSEKGPAELLSQTRYTQPCMVAFAVGVTNLLKEKGIFPDYVCGLSLGEYSALYAAEVLNQEDVIQLVAYRGKVMEEAVKGRQVKMAAVLMMERVVVEECCQRAGESLREQGLIVQVANYNCPGQIVISGDQEAVDLAISYLKEAGARKIVPLAVSGPFHTSLMKPAGDALAKRFLDVSFGPEKSTVIFNATGLPAKEGETIAALLEKQVQSSVYLEDSIRFMEEQGVDTIIEIGPGKAISKFVKKTAPEIKVYSIDSLADYEEVVGAFAGK